MPEMPLEHAPGAPELKPCPFCGGVGELQTPCDARFVSCRRCGCELEAYLVFGDAGRPTLKAMNLWNTRPIEDALRAEVERLTAYADKLADALPMLPADVDNLRRANAAFARDNGILRSAIDEALAIIAGGNPDLPAEVLELVELRLQEAWNGGRNIPAK